MVLILGDELLSGKSNSTIDPLAAITDFYLISGCLGSFVVLQSRLGLVEALLARFAGVDDDCVSLDRPLLARLQRERLYEN